MTVLFDKKITGCEPDMIRNMIKQMMASIKSSTNIDEEEEYEYRLILNELIANSTVHGNRCLCDKSIKVSIRVVNNDFISIRIIDEGSGFDYKETLRRLCKRNNQLSERGRGLKLIKNLCDDIRFNESGNEVCIQRKI